ncbi:MAG: DUF3450 family protein [Planctomycetota bacterium]
MKRTRSVHHSNAARPFRARWVALVLGVPATFALGGSLAAGPQEQESRGALGRAAIEEYIQTRDLIGKEKANLATQLEFLTDRIDLVTRQIEATREEIEKTRSSIEETTTKREELEAENKALEDASSSLDSVIASLEARTKELAKRLPQPIAETINIFLVKIPEDPETTKLGLSERFKNVVAVLNFVDKYNTDVHAESEIRELQTGQSAQVTALYLGISQAYYVNGDGTAAGRGLPSEAGFVWEPLNEAAPAVQKAVQIKNGQVAEFVQLPITVE